MTVYGRYIHLGQFANLSLFTFAQETRSKALALSNMVKELWALKPEFDVLKLEPESSSQWLASHMRVQLELAMSFGAERNLVFTVLTKAYSLFSRDLLKECLWCTQRSRKLTLPPWVHTWEEG